MSRALSVRWRLALVYTAVAVTSACVLVAGIYVLVSLDRTVALLGPLPGEVPVEAHAPVTGDVDRMIVRAQTTAVDRTLQRLLVWSGIGLVLMALVSLAVGWLFAGRALRPVHTITSRARRISAHSLDERLRLDGPHDELREMAETFDSLLDRIQAAFESERRLVATMSHELRTPLANQRATLDVALADPEADAATLRRAGEVALGQVVRAQRSVEALLLLARVQAGVAQPRLEPVRLDHVVAAGLEVARADGPALDWQVQLEPATVQGDQDLLARAVENLLQNAVRHNVPGGWVRVRLVRGSGRATLEVANGGVLLDPAAARSLTLPFRRGGSDRTAADEGTGLGLTLVEAISEHHGGRLDLEALPEGGLRVRLELPQPASGNASPGKPSEQKSS